MYPEFPEKIYTNKHMKNSYEMLPLFQITENVVKVKEKKSRFLSPTLIQKIIVFIFALGFLLLLIF
jgi:hypothetical protein